MNQAFFVCFENENNLGLSANLETKCTVINRFTYQTGFVTQLTQDYYEKLNNPITITFNDQ